MNLFQMSISASVLIIFIIILRVIVIRYRLSKDIIMILWGLVIVRLLIPFSVPYDSINVNLWTRSMEVSQTMVEIMIPYTSHENLDMTETDSTELNDAMPLPKQTSYHTYHINPWILCWPIGFGVSFLIFFRAYRKSYRNIREALPIRENEFINGWLKEQRLERTVRVMVSDHIFTPITLGIIKPIIILPRSMKFKNHQQLSYVLTHEMVHIKHFDTLWKKVSTLVLCLHWFNPLVWLMYFLFNRDMETGCDEKVISIVGENQRSDYALTLIQLVEQRSGYSTMYNGFGKNAIKERIESIMKFKKKTLLGIGLGVILILATIFMLIILSGKFKSGDEYEETIQAVVEQIFTCPDEKMIELYNDMHDDSSNKSDILPPGKIVEFDATEIEKKLEEMYAPYITDEWYDSFVDHFETELIGYSIAVGYEIKIDHIEFTQSKTIPTNYSFTIYLNYGQTDGVKKDIEIEGSAQISEKDGKVSYIRFFIDKDFELELRNARPSS